MKKKYHDLVNQLGVQFSSISVPDKLLRNAKDNASEKLSENQICILRDFKGIPREDLSDQDATNMILDGPLITDESICYYLPRLAKQILLEGGVQGEFLKWRLEDIEPGLLRKDQGESIKVLISYLDEIERELDEEEFEK